MGCVVVKLLDPSPPDSSIRDFWHINGVIIDPSTTDAGTDSNRLQKKPAGVIYVFNGKISKHFLILIK